MVRGETLALVDDEEGGGRRVGEGKLDAGEAPGKGEGPARGSRAGTDLSSSDSLRMGVPVCIVCMRRTWLLLCLS